MLRIGEIEQRLDRLRTDCPYPVVLLHTFAPAGQSDERRIHKLFLTEHFHGEWFRWAGALRHFLDSASADPSGANAELRERIARYRLTMSTG